MNLKRESAHKNIVFPKGITDLILASSSEYRASLLLRLKLPFKALAPDIDETRLPGENPKIMVQRLAREKAEIIAESHRSSLIIGCDQVAVLNEQILGKPGNYSRAVNQLEEISGNTLVFVTSVCLVNSSTGRIAERRSETTVIFKKLTSDQITDYLHKEEPYNCAGSFKSEGLGIALVKSIECQDSSSIIGLPLIDLCDLLYEEGVSVLGIPSPN